MKSTTLTCLTSMTLFAALTIPIRLAAQKQQQSTQQRRYKLVEIGTFVGPNSFSFNGARFLNDKGVATGFADTSIPDPFYPDCF